MSSDVLVRCENVGKKFCRDLKKSLWYGMKDSARDLFSWKKRFVSDSKPTRDSQQFAPEETELRPGEFWANRDVSFELKRGQCLAVIGRNGSGKTTLLKMLNGLIKPDTGHVEMRGRVGAMIALGAGFNPILTGRENVWVNASVLGLSRRQIEDRIDDIVDFADLKDSIDSPVRNYSSGMQVRLGFAVATVLDPDVLILDEVLAVGDASFRHKCYDRIAQLMSNAAVILVTHSMDHVGMLASEVGLLNQGDLTKYTDPRGGIAAYNQLNQNDPNAHSDGGAVRKVYPPVRSADVVILTPRVSYAGRFTAEIHIDCDEDIEDPSLSFSVFNANEQPVMIWSPMHDRLQILLKAGKNILQFSIDPLLLHGGTYRWSLQVIRKNSIGILIWLMRAGHFTVVAHEMTFGDIPYVPVASDFQLDHVVDR
jgi:lipopolysaccharide transport system ATP-binding protein